VKTFAPALVLAAALATALAAYVLLVAEVGAGRGYKDRMVASYYGYEHAGNLTASGKPFNPRGYTAAHPSMPFGTKLLVSYGGRSTVVEVVDKGPFIPGRDLDLSLAAAQRIGLTGPGVGPVEVVVVNPAAITNPQTYRRAP
jgi:rare lipoprotein A